MKGFFSMRMYLQLLAIISIMLFVFNMTSCSTSGALKLSDSDYSDMNNWLSFGGDPNNEVDIFVIYPTVTFSTEDDDKPFVRLDSQLMRDSAKNWLMGTDGIFAAAPANIYAPLYSQLNAAMLESLNSEEFASYTNSNPRDDIFAAFDYYLANINKGERPFIIIGHSQGAHLATELATTFLANEKYSEYNKNHIITYAIGVSVTENQIAKNPKLKFSGSESDTGVIVSWNTTAPSEIESGAYKTFGTWASGALVTNPITWRTNETYASASENKASAVALPGGTVEMVEHYADATVDKEHSVLIVTTVNEADYTASISNISKFHPFDIAFYYESIQQNINDRIESFLHSGS